MINFGENTIKKWNLISSIRAGPINQTLADCSIKSERRDLM